MSTNASALSHFVRPDEIYNCMWESASNATTTQGRQCPHDCACISAPNQNACRVGYFQIGQTERGDNNSPTKRLLARTEDPSALINWCTNPANVDPKFASDTAARDSWVIGCLNGIRGYHKVYRADDQDLPCESLEGKITM
jgi:hypothetical protein